MFFVGYSTFTPRPQSMPYANLNEKKAVNSQQRASAEAKVHAEPVRPQTAAQTMPTKRKTGTVPKKAKRKVASIRRGKS